MRRGSLFAPLLLIGLGVLFLARNLYRDLHLLDYLARYWPLLLILWGVLRLGEILYWAASRQPLPSRGMSGGEWILVVLLCFFGVTLHTVLGFTTWFPPGRLALGGLDIFGESFEYPLAAEMPVSSTPRVVIESFTGNARIFGTDSQQVNVTGRENIRSLDRAAADRANQEMALEITGTPNRVVVQTNQDRGGGFGFGSARRVTADMEISVPKGASIEAHGRSGDFEIRDIEGAVKITSDRAGVHLENIGGEARLDLHSSQSVRAVNLRGPFELKGRGSDIDLENIDGPVNISGNYSGTVQFHNLSQPVHFVGPQTEFLTQKIPGQVRMPLNDFNASNLVGPTALTTRSRDVQISDFTNSLAVTTDRADIELRPALPVGKIDAHARISGDITLELPPGAKFDLTASTSRGDAYNGFEGIVQERSGHGAAMRGSNGGPSVNLRTERGDVKVRMVSPGEPPLDLPFNDSKRLEKQRKLDRLRLKKPEFEPSPFETPPFKTLDQ